MKLAYFFPDSLFSAWSISLGAVDALRRMGHEVTSCPTPPVKQLTREAFDAIKGSLPTVDQLGEHEGVIISGPEHLAGFLGMLYPDWGKLKNVAGWMHETVDRSDYGKLPLDKVRKVSELLFTPAPQDEQYGLKFLPFGVDTHVFRPSILAPSFDVGFVGLLYGPRVEFLKGTNLPSRIRMAKVEAAGPTGTDVRWSVLLLAESYRSFQVFVNLPTLCQHSVTKVTEVAACGVPLVTPLFRNDQRNNQLKQAFYYETATELEAVIDSLLADEDRRWSRANLLLNEVNDHHRIEQRLEVIVEAL